MSLALDNRHLAMLREMGVRLWLPPPAAQPTLAAASDAPHDATDLIATNAINIGAVGTNDLNVAAKTAALAVESSARSSAESPVASPAARPAPIPPLAPARPSAPAAPDRTAAFSTAAPGWQLGDALVLYANDAPSAGAAAGPRWLLLGETPAASLRKPAFDPFEGDAGRLLGNMLRAAGLHKSGQPGEAGAVLLAPLARLAAGGVSRAALPAELAAELTALIAQIRPDVMVVMGRLAAQAVLQSSEPLGKLRGQIHQVHGVKTVVTYDAAVLLRSPQDKAKAWEDLCLAMETAQQASQRPA